MTSEVAKARDALYYPYLHVHNASWLKATLLCFPTVYRMVPSGLALCDPEEISTFCHTESSRGLLLDQVSPADYSIEAQTRLLDKLEEHKDLIRRNFSREQTRRHVAKTGEFSFQVHYLKMLEPLTGFLDREGLVSQSRRGDGWCALHPKLGHAILSTIAIAIAGAKGLAIVTDSGDVHYEVVAADEDQVFEALLGRKELQQIPGPQELTEELAEIVIVNYLNPSRLSAREIAELIDQGEDLQGFKNQLLAIANTIPEIADPAERIERLKEEAEQLVRRWTKDRKSRVWAFADALTKTAEVKFPAMASGLVTAGLVAGNPIMLAVGGALGVFLVVHQGRKIIKEFHKELLGKYPYLSRVANRVGTLNLPPWKQPHLKRAA